MTIEVIGYLKPPPQRYSVVCTDKNCCAIIHLDDTDIRYGTRYSCGREFGDYHGIVCPQCNQILDKSLFKPLAEEAAQ